MDDTERMQVMETLLQRRHELLTACAEINRKWRALHQPLVASEETGQCDALARGSAAFEKIAFDKIAAIDRALAKLKTGTYGRCDACGTQIDRKRLDAVPWAILCKDCRHTRTRESGSGPEEMPGDLPPPAPGLREEITERLREEGVPAGDLEEVAIYANDETLVVGGAVPGKALHAAVLEAAETCAGIHDVRDCLRVDPIAWQQSGHTPAPQETQPAQERMYGAQSQEDSRESMKSGEPLVPPGREDPEQ